MSDADDAIFGKIDALLGKRVGFAGATRQREEIDFPLLTEVVEAPGDDQPLPALTHPDPPPASPEPTASAEATLAERSDPWPLPPGPEVKRLVWGDEPVAPGEIDDSEVSTAPAVVPDEELPNPPDTELEAMLRRIIREELERIHGRG